MKMLLLIALFGLTSALVLPSTVQKTEATKLSGKALSDYVNAKQSLWTAEPSTLPMERMKAKLMKSEFYQPHADEDIVEQFPVRADIPASFDARQQWSQCTSINNIRDQSDCGSCWAFAAAEAISDRTCIHSNGTVNTLLSAEDLLSCCPSCGYGCQGGYPIQAWRWWVSSGVCTGGAFETQFGCKPYSIAPCSETVGNVTWPACPDEEYPTPKCQKKCTTNQAYPLSYNNDKHFGKTAYAVGKKVEQIQTEILTNGPVEGAFTVYEDFYQYKNGIYVHTGGQELGGHAIRILGWGTENGTPYWLVANSWNVNWGENGYFRIIRGTNECGIEHAIVAGIPK